MKALIVCASRYGSTMQIGQWISERLRYEGIETHAADVKNADPVDGYDLIVMGSGIYSHKILPELKAFVDVNLNLLKEKKAAIFGVAMKTTPVFHKGKIHGGLEHLTPQIEMLGGAVIHADMLHGEMVPQKMTEKDREGLLKFYKMLNLSDEEIQKRLSPRTLMDKKEAWEFAETIIKKINTPNADIRH